MTMDWLFCYSLMASSMLHGGLREDGELHEWGWMRKHEGKRLEVCALV